MGKYKYDGEASNSKAGVVSIFWKRGGMETGHQFIIRWEVDILMRGSKIDSDVLFDRILYFFFLYIVTSIPFQGVSHLWAKRLGSLANLMHMLCSLLRLSMIYLSWYMIGRKIVSLCGHVCGMFRRATRHNTFLAKWFPVHIILLWPISLSIALKSVS